MQLTQELDLTKPAISAYEILIEKLSASLYNKTKQRTPTPLLVEIKTEEADGD